MTSYKSIIDFSSKTRSLLSVIYYYILKLIAKLDSEENFIEKAYCSEDFNKMLRESVPEFSLLRVTPIRPEIKYSQALTIVLLNFLFLDNVLNPKIPKRISETLDTEILMKEAFKENKKILSYYLHEESLSFPTEPYINGEDTENILPALLFFIQQLYYRTDYTKAPVNLRVSLTKLAGEIEIYGIKEEDPNESVKGNPIDELQIIDSITDKLDKYINYRYIDINSLKDNAIYRATLKKEAQQAIESVMVYFSEA